MNWQLAKESSARLHDGDRPPLLSRRQFGRTVVGTAAAVAGAGLWKPKLAAAASTGPLRIPGGTPQLGGDFHVFGPSPDGSFDPVDAELATITNFNGFVGLAYLDGTVTRTNTKTNEVKVLPTQSSDMRFMTGVFRGADGRIHKGAFALI